MEENMVIAPNEEIGVEELEENLTGEAEQQQEEENEEWIAGMSDREFAAFSKRAQEAMMAGRKVRVE